MKKSSRETLEKLKQFLIDNRISAHTEIHKNGFGTMQVNIAGEIIDINYSGEPTLAGWTLNKVLNK